MAKRKRVKVTAHEVVSRRLVQFESVEEIETWIGAAHRFEDTPFVKLAPRLDASRRGTYDLAAWSRAMRDAGAAAVIVDPKWESESIAAAPKIDAWKEDVASRVAAELAALRCDDETRVAVRDAVAACMSKAGL